MNIARIGQFGLKLFFCTLLSVCAIGSSSSVQFAVAAPQAGSVSLHITGLNNDKGVVRIALFNSKESYSAHESSADQAFKRDCAPIKGGTSDYTFDGVPYGAYAIKIFHDEDNSGKFVTGAFGIPKVQYAFSNNAHGRFGPAPFEKAKFDLNQPTLKMSIEMLGH